MDITAATLLTYLDPGCAQRPVCQSMDVLKFFVHQTKDCILISFLLLLICSTMKGIC